MFSMSLTVAIASDHAGFALKEYIREKFAYMPVTWLDLGTYSPDRVDYPDFGHKLAQAVASGQVSWGIAICGSGIGISIACNRHAGVRAALCTDARMAELARAHNDANVLCLGERLTPPEQALDMIKVFLTSAFEGGRHIARIEKLG